MAGQFGAAMFGLTEQLIEIRIVSRITEQEDKTSGVRNAF
jgi:hypothetical protein